jgi:UDP-4-amino-4-deoxy-L-arabinose formyltransferase/UDP-glucuronic acid dehydrogenase (UDP-4-keto-hexauronic acid decarboxylating)
MWRWCLVTGTMRMKKIWFRSVAELAGENGIPTVFPEDPNAPDVIDRVGALEPDFIFSFYYRYMLSDRFLDLARKGAYNLHGSLLPRYRGRAPVNWALVNGESETGVTLHRMVKKPDAGPIAAQAQVPVSEIDTVSTLYAKMARAAGELVYKVWPDLAAGRIQEQPQDETKANYCGRRGPEDGKIDWRDSARKIYNLIRAVTHPYPGAFAQVDQGRLFIWSSGFDETPTDRPPGTVLPIDAANGDVVPVACGNGRLLIKSAQWENQKEYQGPELPELGLKPGMRLK